ncbi:DUF6151 family protein (plasmid) [Pseudoalteromonas sp. T1lg65]|uniref:DUF6151 family protein n=1 Tax=Pseudoalteromonas sp. T1lg65 TaxID=2077101 RepID=UPI003F7AB422
MNKLNLSCQCNQVTGHIENITPNNANNLTCYCSDCRQFAIELQQQSTVLDVAGGTQIVQVPLSHFHLDSGKEHLACLKLSNKGMHRWYANCCSTPIGNTVSANWPFIGVIHSFIQDPGLDAKAGVMQGAVHEKEATSPIPIELRGPHKQGYILFKTLLKFAKWKLQGKNSPSCLYEKDGKPVCKPKMLN